MAGTTVLVFDTGADADLGDRPLADHVLTALAGERPDRITADATGLAAAVRRNGRSPETVLVVRDTAPLVTADAMLRLVEERVETGAEIALLTGKPVTPPADWVETHAAEALATGADNLTVAAYAFGVDAFFDAAESLATEGDPLSELARRVRTSGGRVVAVDAIDWRDAVTVADPVTLAFARRTATARLVRKWMLRGVTILDPATTWLGADVELAPGTTLLPNVRMTGKTTVAADCTIGPDVTLTATTVGESTRIRSATCEHVVIGDRNIVGPYAYLRGNTHTGNDVIAGSFVEIKQTRVGDHTHIPHFACVIDGIIGERCNVGAFSGLANYDGIRKQTAVVGDDAMIASGTAIMAPARIGDGACTAAGTIVTKDVPPGALAMTRARLVTVDGWTESRFPGSTAAESARRALDVTGTA